MTMGTTGITTLSQDSFSRIDALLTRARETTETKRTALDTAGQTGQAGQAVQGVPASPAAVPTAEADQAYSAVMGMLSAPSSDAHRSLDPERVARLLNL